MNKCSIITIIIIKIIIKYCLLQFKAAIKPLWYWKKLSNKEGKLRMPRTIRYQDYQIDPEPFNAGTWNYCGISCSFKRSLSLFTVITDIDIRNSFLCLWPKSLSPWHLHEHERNVVCLHDIHMNNNEYY